MEKLSESFLNSFSVSCEPNDTAAEHPRLSQFKVKPRNVPDQNVRRIRMLDQQKRKRCDYVNYARKLVEGDLEEDDQNFNDDEEKMDATCCEEKKRIQKKRINRYSYQLMLSEWLVDIPDNLVDDWLMVICPVGKRNLVIASNGNTSAYTKSGYMVNRFSSFLPCGSPDTCKPGEYTILDCIFDELLRTFYILDVMCWRGHPVYDSETEFRFYWMRAKLEEEPALGKISSSNEYKFVALNSCPCKPETISSIISAPSSFKIDGLLFYHKRTHYTHGRTPLVGWLKPYMLPKILGIPVSPEFMAEAPPVNKLTLLEANKELRCFDEEKENKTRQNVSEEMETDTPKKQRRRRKNKNKAANKNEMDVYEGSTKYSETNDIEKKDSSKRISEHSEEMELSSCIEKA